ncbi:MAG: flavin reductase family protein [Candidatus Aminicenantes bacterium]|nr:flavin reductase family protein [Candidatus Aminicenantes bacterium]
MKKTTTKIENFQYFYPYSVALVGAKSRERTNFMSCAWHTALSFKPPLFAVLISKKRMTHEIISEAKEFTVNFISFEKIQRSAQFGRISGKDMDKISHFGLKTSPGKFIGSPIITEAYASFECRLKEIRTYGDHDLFVGEVKAVHEDKNIFDRSGVLNVKKLRPLLYLGSDIYTTVNQNEFKHVLPED